MNVKNNRALKNGTTYILLFLTFLLALFLKDGFEHIRFPFLPYEDGRDYFPMYYNHHSIQNIFRFYSGYITIFPNLTAYLATLFPAGIAVHLFVLISNIFAAASFVAVFRAIRYYTKDTIYSVIAIIALVILPLGNIFLVGTIYCLHWSTFTMLFFSVIVPPPESKSSKILLFLVLSLAIWSHPYSVSISLLYLFFIVIKRDVKWNSLLLAVTVLYAVFGIQYGAAHDHTFAQIHRIFFERIIAETWLGPVTRFHSISYGSDIIYYGAITALMLITMAIIYGALRSENKQRYIYILLLSYGLFAFYAISIVTRHLDQSYIYRVNDQRFVYISKICYFCLLVGCLHMLCKRRIHKFMVYASLTLLCIINLNSNFLYSPYPGQGKLFAEFIDYVEHTAQCTPQTPTISLDRGGWSITLDLCRD